MVKRSYRKKIIAHNLEQMKGDINYSRPTRAKIVTDCFDELNMYNTDSIVRLAEKSIEK